MIGFKEVFWLEARTSTLVVCFIFFRWNLCFHTQMICGSITCVPQTEGDVSIPLNSLTNKIAKILSQYCLKNCKCAWFKQKKRLGCIYDSEIQALGSGVKKIDSVFFHFFLHHWLFICHLKKNWSMGGIFSTAFCGIFIVHLLYQGMWLETLNGLISKVVFWTT